MTLGVADVVAALLHPFGEPRDGTTVLGGEPFFQPQGLAALLRALKGHDVHTVVYTGYTLEALACRRDPEVQTALRLTDLLVDAPFVAALAEGAGHERALAKLRALDSGHAYVEDVLRRFGAPPRRGADPTEWLSGALCAAGVRRLHHPGNHRYLFRLGGRTAKRAVLVGPPSPPYPKQVDRPDELIA